jgi:hypothetical protein
MATASAPRPRRIYGRERLSRLFKTADVKQDLRRGTIEAINTDGTVDIRLPDGVRQNVEVGAWYSPVVGESVRLLRADPFSLFVLGATRSSAPATLQVRNSILLPYNVTAPVTTAPAPDPAVSSGTSYFNATATRSYRSSDGWSRAEVYQGAYDSSTTHSGYWYGCYFYGTAPQSLKGKTVTSASIRIYRRTSGGNSANVPQYIAPHNHYSQPGGGPYFTAAASLLGYVDWGQYLDLPLPVSWAQALINGTATVRGFGHRRAATGSSYSVNYAKSSQPTSGRLTIRWKG